MKSMVKIELLEHMELSRIRTALDSYVDRLQESVAYWEKRMKDETCPPDPEMTERNIQRNKKWMDEAEQVIKKLERIEFVDVPDE